MKSTLDVCHRFFLLYWKIWSHEATYSMYCICPTAIKQIQILLSRLGFEPYPEAFCMDFYVLPIHVWISPGMKTCMFDNWSFRIAATYDGVLWTPMFRVFACLHPISAHKVTSRQNFTLSCLDAAQHCKFYTPASQYAGTAQNEKTHDITRCFTKCISFI